MQKELWKLAVSGMKKRKRNSLLLFGVLVIAFFFFHSRAFSCGKHERI